MNKNNKWMVMPFLIVIMFSVFLYSPKSSLAAGTAPTKIISTAKHLIGTPYHYGGESPRGFDCSGFVNYVFKQNGISLTRSSSTLWVSGGIRVSEPMPGDILFFNTNGSSVSHVGIYIGNNEFVHSASGGVQISCLSEKYYRHTYVGSKRFL
ncbi:MAG: C40 family peptidase [Bacillota bacterium]|nr:C40 family peptidase [Bacillota bacterium]